MSDKDSTRPSEGKAAGKGLFHGLRTFEISYVALILLSVIGVAVTDFSRRYSHWYWYAMVPVFACACLIMEWARARNSGKSRMSILRPQLLTWFGLMVAVSLTHVLLFTGRLDYENTGLVLLLLLALTTFFAGVELGYHLCLLGGFLALTLLMMTYMEEYVWVVLLAGILGVAITVYAYKRRLNRLKSA